jgi:PIN domain nuclease of toxin-antitoxin system
MGRAKVILLDTRARIWLSSDRSLGAQSQKLADQAKADDGLVVAAISFWELAMLVAKRAWGP